MTLLSGENVSRRISESRPGSGKEAKESKGKKEGKEESGGKKQFRLHYCILNPNLIQKRTNTKKALKRFCLRASVKTATTYSPTCAVPSA
jgi:hypothetical protein